MDSSLENYEMDFYTKFLRKLRAWILKHYSRECYKFKTRSVLRNGHISMFIVLPNKITGLNNFIKTITPKDLQELRWSMQREEVDVRIPKFTFDYNSELKDALMNLGISKIFSDIPDFTGIQHNATKEQLKDIKVSDIVQKVGIDINEEGTTAYVASAATLVNKFGGQPIFNASRPFLFYLEDEISGNILFIGKMINPEKAEKLDEFKQIIEGKINLQHDFDSRKH